MRAAVAQNRNTLETTGRGSGPERAEGGAGEDGLEGLF